MSGSLKLYLRTAIAADNEWQLLKPGALDVQIPDDALPLYLYVEGLGAERVTSEHFECRRGVVADSSGSRRFIWTPFEHDGDLAYGFFTLRLSPPTPTEGRPLDFRIEIIGRRLGTDLYTTLFTEVCRVADGLVTEWYSQRNPLLGITYNPAPTRFSAATALAEMADEWQRFETSTRRIARSPRKEFLPTRPGRPSHGHDDADCELPSPLASADIYENRLVMLTLQRTVTLLAEIQSRAQSTLRSEQQRLVFLKDAHHFPKVEPEVRAKIAECQKIIAESEIRLSLLRRCIRSLSQVRTVHALKSRVPNTTPRIRMLPDYHQVLGWWRTFGQQRFVSTRPESLSALSTRRSSSIYEYWVLLALFSALQQLGYRSRIDNIEDLVTDELLDLDLLRDRPIEFYSASADETITLWYEPQGVFHPRPGESKPMKVKDWEKYLQTNPVLSPGLYSRSGPLTPDFLLELRRADQFRVAVGDAIFSEGVERATGIPSKDVVPKKTQKVATYLLDLIWVRSGSAPLRMHKTGLVIFCGHDKHIAAMEKEAGAVELLALRPLDNSAEPSASASAAAGSHIVLSQASLDRLADFIAELRGEL